MWPCYWSTAIAADIGTLPNPTLLVLFGIGAFSMRSAGCIVNDLWDQDIDKQVERTATTRPLATGEITPRQAIGFLAITLSTGLGVLLSLPNQIECLYWGIPSLGLLTIYPTMKRFFIYPQLFLGITMNWGCFLGYVAVRGTIDPMIVLPLYGSGIGWTLVYDTIYGHQDKHDDQKLGLQSTALSFGKSTIQQKRILYGLALATYVQWLFVGYHADILLPMKWFVNNSNTAVDFNTMMSLLPYYGIGTTVAYTHLLWQIATVDLNNPTSCMERFQSNTTVGGIIFASIAAGTYIQ